MSIINLGMKMVAGSDVHKKTLEELSCQWQFGNIYLFSGILMVNLNFALNLKNKKQKQKSCHSVRNIMINNEGLINNSVLCRTILNTCMAPAKNTFEICLIIYTG